MTDKLTRRDFLKLAAAGALALRPFRDLRLLEFPQAEKLGRITHATY
ncbi:MAG: twin-arginine translocation signal domain-containing protein [Chloroflexi bacterium]|nr:twin-arginine translocation signal domain-containing protein [Chloroflexota bacterium]